MIDEFAPPRGKRTLTLRRVEANTEPEELADAMIPGIDDLDGFDAEAPEPANWWEPDSFYAVEMLLRPLVESALHARRMKDMHAAIERGKLARIAAILRHYSHLVEHEFQVPEGKTRKSGTGDWTGIKYTHQPERLPVLKLVDKDAARDAGLLRERVTLELDTALAREMDAGDLPQFGVAVTPQPAVSYKLPGEAE